MNASIGSTDTNLNGKRPVLSTIKHGHPCTDIGFVQGTFTLTGSEI